MSKTAASDWYVRLRQAAESQMGSRPASAGPAQEDLVKLVHELEAYRVELELQNEELRLSRDEAEAARNRYAELYEFAPVGYLSLDRRGIILQGNLAACAQIDRPRTQVTGQPFAAFMDPADGVMFSEFLARAFKTGGPVAWEGNLRRKDGAALRARVVAEADRSRDECRMAVTDVTGQHDKTVELQRLYRTQRAISNSRLALLHATEESAYLNEVCRILVEDCGHAMVWIGLAGDEPGKAVRPVAWAGFEPGYIEALKLSWADNEYGRGPTGTAIRTARAAFCRDMRSDPRFDPWRDEALSRGYVSSAAFPLCDEGGKAFGALNVYTRAPGPLLDDEVGLLAALADDLALGIRTLRARDAHAETATALARHVVMLRTITENSPEPIFMLDARGRLAFANSANLALLQQYGRVVGEPLEDKLGRTAEELIADPALGRAVGAVNRRVLRSGRGESVERVVESAGGRRIFQVVRTPLVDAYGRVTGLVGTARDITEQRQDEAARMARLERQRDTLVREVHHRIKNHLQGVVGLLHNRQAQSPSLAPALQETIDQIRVIAEVYGLQGRQEARPITVCQLVDAVMQGSVQRVPVVRDCVSEPGPLLAPNEVMPVSLIINELLSNALKHLREPTAERPVRIEVVTGPRQVQVRVRSGPAQLPVGFDFAQGLGTGTGLELVRSLLPSAGASLVLRQDGDEVVAELDLTEPVILPATAA